MHIAVIGTGRVGTTLGAGWAKRGHTVVFASREPEGVKAQAAIAAAGPAASAAPVGDAVRSADVVVLAVPWSAAQSSLAAAGDLRGKVLVDATNAVGSGLTPGFAPPASAAEQVAAWAPGARVVKAFNTTGFDNMADPVYDGQATTMFICGDDAAAKATVADLAGALGFEAADAGPLAAAFHLENLALLWIHLARQPAYGRDIAFRLLRR